MANMRPSWPPPRTPIVDPGGMTRDITLQIHDCRLLIDCRLIVDAWVIADCRLHGTRDRRMVPIWNQSAIAISNLQSEISNLTISVGAHQQPCRRGTSAASRAARAAPSPE